MDRKKLEKKQYLSLYNKLLIEVASNYDNVTVINSFDYLCDDKICPISIDNKMLYIDDNHLSYEGSRIIAKEIFKLIKQKTSQY